MSNAAKVQKVKRTIARVQAKRAMPKGPKIAGVLVTRIKGRPVVVRGIFQRAV
jgi:hypothetical protein